MVDCLTERFKRFGLDPEELCVQIYENNYYGLLDSSLSIDAKDIVGHFKYHYHHHVDEHENCEYKFERDYFQKILTFVNSKFKCFKEEILITEYRKDLLVKYA